MGDSGRQGGTPKFGPQFHGVDNFLIVPRNHVLTVSEPWDKFDNVPFVSGSKHKVETTGHHPDFVNEKPLQCAFFGENVNMDCP